MRGRASKSMAREQRQRQSQSSEEEGVGVELRRGPWTVEEDLLLVNYIAAHGEGRWNALARCAGLRRTGKSCRLRWLNYLRPDLRRGSMTAEEQVVILELHARWGNRWSKIAQHLPGRTDNEIKNYWRTRVQKHARHLNCDVNSRQFNHLMRCLWMPRLLERIRSGADAAPPLDHLSPAPELSCTTSLSTDAQAQLVDMSPPPPLLSAPAPGNNIDTAAAAAAAMCDVTDTVCQQLVPTQQQQPVSQFGADAYCSWPDSLAGQHWYAGDMVLPELDLGGLDDTAMWAAGAGDELWYTQMLGM